MGNITKVILQDICISLRIALNINQWFRTNHYIWRFTDYDKNYKCSIEKYNIKNFYPSITEKKHSRGMKFTKGIYFDSRW